jgi:hypothetical protein
MPTEEEYRAHGAAPFAHMRATAFTPLALDEAEHTIDMMVSTGQWARDGQRILPQAWQRNLGTYLENPQVTWAHSWWEPGIGLCRDAQVRDNGLWARLWFDVDDEEIARIWQAIRTTRVRCASVSWDGEMAYTYPRKIGDNNEFGEWVERADGSLGWEWRDNITLMEIAMVPIPSDTGANTTLSRMLGIASPPTHSPERQLAHELPGRGGTEAEVLEYLGRLNGAAEWLRNWTRHVAKGGGAPSPAVIEQALSPLGDLIEIAAGRTGEARALSADNRALVDGAVEALQRLAGRGEEEGRAFTAATPAGPAHAGVPGAPGGDHGQTLDGLLANIEEQRAEAALRAVGMRS